LFTPQVLWTRVTNRHTHGQAKLIRVKQREGLIGSCAADKKQLVLCCKVGLHCTAVATNRALQLQLASRRSHV
jgi:hypothetical protein